MQRPIALLALLFTGCVTKADELASLDRDGDGWYHEAATSLGEVAPFDCDDDDAAVYPGAAELCDGIDQDCDGVADNDVTTGTTFWRDADGDGFGDEGEALTACAAPDGYIGASGDCDDSVFDVKPGAEELCNGEDDDCDGATDDGFTLESWYPDEDEDGYGAEEGALEACAQPAGYVATSGDCDDAMTAAYPGADELCNGEDDDCDGAIDDGLDLADWYADADGDGHGDDAALTEACVAPPGHVATSGDCDDTTDARSPDAVEVCNDLDDDCDDTADEGLVVSAWYVDDDGDGYGDDEASISDCAAPIGYVALSGDCDDGDTAFNPGASEADCSDPTDYNCDGATGYEDSDGDGFPACEDCDDYNAEATPDGVEACNGFDDDCDGSADGADAIDVTTWYADGDGDGFGTTAGVEACDAPTGYASLSTDCDDTSAADRPGAAEVVANGDDDDCDGYEACWADVDGDGSGASGTISSADTDCTDAGEAAATGDCDDTSSSIEPGATESCNGADDDCDGAIDEGVTSTFYLDVDGDGYGVSTTMTAACSAPAGYVANSSDCDDAAASDHPGATEAVGNEDDEDCNGGEVCYSDSDRDGFGGSSTVTSADADCADAGEATASSDCDDGSSSDYPGASEACDGDDDDCDGSIDDGVLLTWYRDADSDSYGTTITTTTACSAPSGYVALSTDCDDGSVSDHPGATELVADGDDEDCDGGDTCYADADKDTYGGTGTMSSADMDCSDSGEAAVSADCDDSASAIKPGATETCNGTDDDCDGSTDEGVTTTYYKDGDGDSYGTSSLTSSACSLPSGYAIHSTDCDDSSASDHPGATETAANGDDDDCDGFESCYTDGDLDGYGGTTTVYSAALDCSNEGESALSTDCADSNAERSPSALEICDDTVDDDCDGEAEACLLSGTLYVHTQSDAFFSGEGADDKAAMVAYAGDVDGDGIGDILVGARDATAGDGRVYLMYGPHAGSMGLGSADVIFTAGAVGDDLGESVSRAGDFNGDGEADLLFGAPGYDTSTSATSAGAVYLVFGPPASGSASTADVILTGAAMGDTAGAFVASAGDVDSDGYDDLLIGAPGDDDAGSGAGAAYLWLGEPSPGSTGSLATADAKIRGVAAGDAAGGVVGPGDVNGDGLPDVLIGARLWDTSSTVTQVGAVYLFLAPISGTLSASTDADATVRGVDSGDRFGSGLSGGDINGDGYADFCTGAIGYGSTNTGAALVFHGPMAGTTTYTTAADAIFVGAAGNDMTGGSVACDGDTNGDGAADVVVGAMNNMGLGGSGATYLFHSSPTGTIAVADADAIIASSYPGVNLGFAVALAPDADGTGYAGVLTGSEGEAAGGSWAGGVWLFFGGP